MKRAILRIALAVVSLPVFSRLWGRIMGLKRPRCLVRRAIRAYCRHYRIDMDQYQGQLDDYRCLVDFFVRPFDPVKRPLNRTPGAIVSPADGFLQGIQAISVDQATQVKGIQYTISGLIRQDLDFSAGFYLATIYLSPANYHRFHYPVSAGLEGYCHARGRLFPVNALGMNLVKGLFTRNERIISRFSITGAPLFMVAVGASFVGSIKMVFIDRIKRDNLWHEVNLEVNQADEMGRFEMGSTVILLVPASLAAPDYDRVGKPIFVGDPLFSLT